MPLTTCTTRSTGYMPSVSVWNAEHVDNINWLSGDRPSCKAYSTVALSIPAGAQYLIPFDQENWDVGGIHSTAVNTYRFTAPVFGRYRMTAWAKSTFVGANYFSILEPFVNGAGTGHRVTGAHTATVDAGVQLVNEYVLLAGGYIEVAIQHTHIANLDWYGSCLVEWVSR
jgi:hypothetical protein